jgi:prophage DNA circulation protein
VSLFSIISLVEGLELQGSYRGIPFYYDRELQDDQVGRRTKQFMFPGQDIQVTEDLGAYNGDIVVKGIVSGDDANHQLDRLRDAVTVPAPATLVNPWLGSIQVVLKERSTPRFSYSPAEGRIGRWTAVFRRFTPRPPTQTDTLQALLDALTDARAAANAMLAEVLAPVALGLSAISQVESIAGDIATTLGGLIGACSNPLVGIAGALPIGLLSSLAGVTPGVDYPATVGAVLSAPTQAIAQTSAPLIPAAVAPGGSTATPVPVDGRVTATLILSAASTISVATASGAPVNIPPGPALIVSVQACMLCDATNAASTIAYASQQEATAWRNQVAVAIDGAIATAAGLVGSSPEPATTLWSALIAMRAAWISDMNTVIGRLPPVVIFTPPGAAPVWVLAQYLAGDDPTKIIPLYFDIISRNNITHPAEPGPGPFEVLA